MILLAALRVGQVFDIIAHRQHHLLGHQPFIDQLQHKGIRHLAYNQPRLVKFGGAVQYLPAADAGGRRLVCLDVRKGTRLPPPCMVDQQLGVGAEQAVKQLLVIKIAFLSQRTTCHIAHGIQPVRLQFFGIAAPDPPKICQRLVFPQQAAVALLIQFGNAHAVFVRRDMLCLHVHRHLGKIQIAANARRGGDAGHAQDLQDQLHGKIVGSKVVQLQIGRCINEYLINGIAVDILRRDKLQINAVDLGAFGDIMAHLRRCNDVVQLIFRVLRQLRCAGTLAGKFPPGSLCAPPCVGLPHLLHDLKQPRTSRYAVCFQGRRNRQTDGLLCAGGIRHHQVGGKGIQTALNTFYRCEKGF